MIAEFKQVLYSFKLFGFFLFINQKLGEFVYDDYKKRSINGVLEDLRVLEQDFKRIIISLLAIREYYERNFEGDYLVSYEELQRNLFLKDVVKEALRLYPEILNLNKKLLLVYGDFIPDQLRKSVHNPVQVRSIEIYNKAINVLLKINPQTDKTLLKIAQKLL